MNTTRIDITGGVLRLYPTAVVTRSQTEAGLFYEVRLPKRPDIRPVRLMVEWGDDEAQCLDIITERIASQLLEKDVPR